eukprot:evm.model.NODE_38400_length_6715_cov_52.424423.4
MGGNETVGNAHMTTTSRLSQSVCVTLAQTQDELSGARQEILITQAASHKALAATRAGVVKAKGKSESKGKELGEAVARLSGLGGGSSRSSSGGNGGVDGQREETEATAAAAAAPVVTTTSSKHQQKEQHRLEAKVAVLRDEAAAADRTLQEATEAYALQKSTLAAQVDIILQALSSREEERVSKTKTAFHALYQAELAAIGTTKREEEATRESVSAIDITRDLQAFVARHLGGGGGGEEKEGAGVTAAMGQTMRGSKLAESLEMMAQGGERRAAPLRRKDEWGGWREGER